MNRTAIFVDAAYLYAAGSRLIAGERLPRSRLNLDYDAVLQLLTQVSQQLTGQPLLRCYWYDGSGSGPTPPQRALAYRANVKLRLGFVTPHGEQQGVNALMVNDLLTLTRNRAMADAVILTGDEDVRVGVQQAQECGIRVHILGIEPSRENQSALLAQDADTLRELSRAEVGSFLSKAAPRAPREVDPEAGDEQLTLEDAARDVAESLHPDEVEDVLSEATEGGIPGPIDRRLLIAGTQALGGGQLSPEQKRVVRAAFLDACRDVWHG